MTTRAEIWMANNFRVTDRDIVVHIIDDTHLVFEIRFESLAWMVDVTTGDWERAWLGFYGEWHCTNKLERRMTA